VQDFETHDVHDIYVHTIGHESSTPLRSLELVYSYDNISLECLNGPLNNDKGSQEKSTKLSPFCQNPKETMTIQW